jgi:4-amino-4-deoxy-L-arabinose transferase-like glycosyltransferase
LSARRWVIPVAMCAVVIATCAIYLHSLDSVPLVVTVDEARFALHANALVTTGADLAGNRWPVFFHITDPLDPVARNSIVWWQPALFYLVAGVFRFSGPSEWALRLPTTILAIVNVILIYFVARKLFSNGWYAVIAAGLLALTPGHYMFARRTLDYFCALPIALAWLYCLCAYAESAAPWPGAMGLLLGVGLFTHISSWIVMPTYLAVTCLVFRRLRTPPGAYGWLTATFALPLLMIVPALIARPSLPLETFTHYKVPVRWAIADRINVVWSFLDPSYLFFSGGPHPMFATQRGGVLAIAALLLLPLGIWSVIQGRGDLRRNVVMFGFFFAPVPVALALPQDSQYWTPRDLLAVPFAALLCTIGIEWLFQRANWGARLFAVALLMSVPFQFVGFADYFLHGYQQASAPRIDPLNLKGAAEFVISADRASSVPRIYLSEDVGSPHAYQWAFYLLERHREDLWARSRHFDSRESAGAIPGGSLLVFDAADGRLDQVMSSMGCSLFHVVSGVDGRPATAVLRRN